MESMEAEYDVKSLKEIPFLDIGSSRYVNRFDALHCKVFRRILWILAYFYCLICFGIYAGG